MRERARSGDRSKQADMREQLRDKTNGGHTTDEETHPPRLVLEDKPRAVFLFQYTPVYSLRFHLIQVSSISFFVQKNAGHLWIYGGLIYPDLTSMCATTNLQPVSRERGERKTKRERNIKEREREREGGGERKRGRYIYRA